MFKNIQNFIKHYKKIYRTCTDFIGNHFNLNDELKAIRGESQNV